MYAKLSTLREETETYCHYWETRSPLRLSHSTAANRKEMTYWKTRLLLPGGQGILRISCIKKKYFSFCPFLLPVSYPFSGAQTAIFHDHKHLWGCVCLRECACVWGGGLLCVMLMLEGYKTAGVFLTSLRGPYLFSLATFGSAIRSEASLPAASRQTKKHAHTPLPPINNNNNNSKSDSSLKNAKIFLLWKSVKLSYIYTWEHQCISSVQIHLCKLLRTVKYSHEGTERVYTMRELSFSSSSPVLTLLMLIQGQDFVNYIYSIMRHVLSIHIRYKDRGWWGNNFMSLGGPQTNQRSGKRSNKVSDLRSISFLDPRLTCWSRVSLPPSLQGIWVDRRCKPTSLRCGVATASGCLCNTAGRYPAPPSGR